MNFYAKDHADSDQLVHAFASKDARDKFVLNGNRRFALRSEEANELCKKHYERTALQSVKAGFI